MWDCKAPEMPSAASLKEAHYRAEMNAKCDAATRETAFQSAAHAFAMVNELQNRIEALAERLVGPEPGVATNGQSAPIPSGIFGALDAAANEAKRRVSDAHAALSRIERAIG
jgi:hypothetical protein